jgi:hypothetical protein
LQVEPEAIAMICRVNSYGNVVKNEQQYENDFATGTPDMVHTMIGDAKSSWSVETFPLFETAIPDKKYEWQVQTYMWLTGLERAAVHYCLVDTPDSLIDYEAMKIARAAGFEEVEFELYEEVRSRLTYSDIPEAYRVKTFTFDRDEDMIAQIEGQVELCRTYISEVLMPLYSSIHAEPIAQVDHTTLSDADRAALNALRGQFKTA